MPRTNLLILAAISTMMSTTAQAQSANDQFSATTNPNGAWRYGWTSSLGGAFNLFSLRQAQNGLNYWYEPITAGPAPGYPLIAHNPTPNSVSVPGGTILANQLVLHPGVGNQYAVIRWIAPQAQLVNLMANFTRVDFAGPTTTDVHVLVNGSLVYSGALSALLAGATFTNSFTVSAGSTIDFAVGYGSNGNYFNDGTGLFATLSTVPEPNTVLLLVAGFGAIALVRLIRRRA